MEVRGPCFCKVALVYILISVNILPLSAKVEDAKSLKRIQRLLGLKEKNINSKS